MSETTSVAPIPDYHYRTTIIDGVTGKKMMVVSTSVVNGDVTITVDPTQEKQYERTNR